MKEKVVDKEIGYKYQNKLAKRNSELAKQVIDLKAKVERWKREVIYLNNVVGEVIDNYE